MPKMYARLQRTFWVPLECGPTPAVTSTYLDVVRLADYILHSLEGKHPHSIRIDLITAAISENNSASMAQI